MKARSLVTVLGLIAAVPQASFAQQKAAARANPEGVVRVAYAAPPLSMDPHTASTSGSPNFANLLYDRLTRINAKAEVLPMLATSWSANADATALEFKLRKDVKFHDGTPFDAAAVKANIERGKTVAGSTVNGALEAITAVEVVDPYTVRMRLASGQGAAVPAVLASPAGMMLSPKAFSDSSRNLSLNPGNAGSGPYVAAEFEPRSRVIFERAPGKHWEPGAGIAKRIEMRFVQQAGARLNAARAGQVELAHILGTDITQAQQVVASGGRLKGVHLVTANSQALFVRGDRISDPRVRKAIQLAIDRNAIANRFLNGVCTAAAQPYPKSHWASAPDVAIDYDPARARALLKEAGANDFRLDINVNSGSASEPIAQIIQSQLAEVGIRASITPQPTGDTRGSFYRGEFDGYTGILQARPEPSELLDEVFLTRFKVLAPVPAADFTRVKELAEKALDPRLKQAQRAEMYRQIWKVNAERGYVVPICLTHHYWLMDAKLGGFERDGIHGADIPDLRFLHLTQ